METLRCPKCLNPLFDGGAKKCSACGARLKGRGRSAIADDEIAARPRALVERELQARIEAQTASGFRQRRRAAKTARRIAALPPSLFDAAGAALVDAGTAPWSASSAPNPVVIDLPVSAIHDMKPLRVESEVVHVREPEPLALVAPIIEIAPEAEPEPEPIAFAPEPEPAPMDTTPGRAHRRRTVRAEHRWRLRRTSRPVADDTPTRPVFEPFGGSLFEPDDAPPVDGAEAGERTAVDEAEIVPEFPVVPMPESIVAEPEIEPEPEPEPAFMAVPEPVDEPEPEPVAVVPAPEPEPDPIEAEPEPVVVAPKRAAQRKWQPASVAPRGADSWQPSTSLWARRVFDAGNQRKQVVAWPRPYEPPADDHIARDYIDAEVAETAPTD